jgi:hypothetical protein
MKTFSYKVTIKTVKGSELSVPYEEHVPVLQPETWEDINLLMTMDEYGTEAICKAVFESLKLRANASVRRRLENQDSPKAARAMTQAWILGFAPEPGATLEASQPRIDLRDKLLALLVAQADTSPFLDAIYEKHGEAIRDWNREKSNTFNQRP